MTGFMPELIQPSHVTTWKTMAGCEMQSMHTPEITLVRKNGSQQMMNTPITVPSVFAAFFSFENLDRRFEIKLVRLLDVMSARMAPPLAAALPLARALSVDAVDVCRRGRPSAAAPAVMDAMAATALAAATALFPRMVLSE